jgi:hypothetical protein
MMMMMMMMICSDNKKLRHAVQANLCPSSFSSSIRTTTLRWISACSTTVEHSQQEGFTECCCQRHVQPPTWRTRDLEHSHFCHKRPPVSEATLANPAAEGIPLLNLFISPCYCIQLYTWRKLQNCWTVFLCHLIFIEDLPIHSYFDRRHHNVLRMC